MSIRFLAILTLVLCSDFVEGYLKLETRQSGSRRALGISQDHSGGIGTSLPRRSNSLAIEQQYELSKEGRTQDGAGLMFNVIHRQHPNSPYRSRQQDQVQEGLRRGLLRERSLNNAIAAERAASISSMAREPFKEQVIVSDGEWLGEYLVEMEIGIPGKLVLLIIDTGSGLTWIQCSPCVHCFSQNLPLFSPDASASYKPVNCSSPACSESSTFQCSGADNNTCEFGIAYGQSSFSTGVVSQDTLTVESFAGGSATVKIEDFLFGCGVYNEGNYIGNSGLLGLSRTNISFPTQLARLNYSKKFTYCFADLSVNRNATSYIYFGDSRPHNSMRFTPFAPTPFVTQFYYVGLIGISVDENLLPINSSAFDFNQQGNGGTVIDSGTTLTLLVPQAYNLLRDGFRAAAASRGKLPDMSVEGFNSSGHVIDTCYQFYGEMRPQVTAVPSITLHFANAFNLTLASCNILFPFNDDGLYCLAFSSTQFAVGINVIGNIQQQNFMIEYDLENSRIGFQKAYCSGQQ